MSLHALEIPIRPLTVRYSCTRVVMTRHIRWRQVERIVPVTLETKVDPRGPARRMSRLRCGSALVQYRQHFGNLVVVYDAEG